MVLAWLQKCTADYLKLSEVSTLHTFSSRKWTGRCRCSELWATQTPPCTVHVFSVSDIHLVTGDQSLWSGKLIYIGAMLCGVRWLVNKTPIAIWIDWVFWSFFVPPPDTRRCRRVYTARLLSHIPQVFTIVRSRAAHSHSTCLYFNQAEVFPLIAGLFLLRTPSLLLVTMDRCVSVRLVQFCNPDCW